MSGHVWLEDSLRPTHSRLREDIARTAELGYDSAGHEAVVLDHPFLFDVRDVLKVTRRRSLLDRLRRRRRRPQAAELMLVQHAGGTFLWVERGYAGTQRGIWHRGDHVELIAVARAAKS